MIFFRCYVLIIVAHSESQSCTDSQVLILVLIIVGRNNNNNMDCCYFIHTLSNLNRNSKVRAVSA